MDISELAIKNVVNSVSWFSKIKWQSAAEAEKAIAKRDALLAQFAPDQLNQSFGDSKPHRGALSPGCQKCGDGEWSCFYVTNQCNLSCYFCPQDRNATGHYTPEAEELNFTNVNDYIAYLERFGFTGASFSGGGPMLEIDKVADYTRAIKAYFGDKMYVWMYTNGSLATPAKLEKLRDAGLDELRFDIAAINYNLKMVKAARALLPTVSVEIPALPEDIERVKQALHTMDEIGVDFLNLHQLIITAHNHQELLPRGYQVAKPEVFYEPPVVDSELAALEILAYAAENNIKTSINYCSHIFKSRWQNRARRVHAAKACKRADETVTAAGYLRRVEEMDSAETIIYEEAEIVKFKRTAGDQLITLDGGKQVFIARKQVGTSDEHIAKFETMAAGFQKL